MTTYKMIVNPVAGRGAGEQAIQQIEPLLSRYGLDFDLVRTERPWHAADLAQGAAVEGYDCVVAVGGDGARQLAAVVQDIKLGVAEHYVGVLRAERAVAVSGSYVASLRSHTENARSRYEFGDVPQNDYLAASVTLANAEKKSRWAWREMLRSSAHARCLQPFAFRTTCCRCLH